MSGDNGDLKKEAQEEKLIFRAAKVGDELSITIGKDNAIRDIVWAAKLLNMEIENRIIAMHQTPKKIQMVQVPGQFLNGIRNRLHSKVY